MISEASPDVRRVVRLFYGFQFFFGMLLWVPIFYDYQKQVGLSDPQIFGIQSIYYLAFCLLEIPTGALADVWGHRLCMRAGAVVLTVANLLPLLISAGAPGGISAYGAFLAHFLGVALARSLISGASSAYLYDYLKLRGETAIYKRVEGNARSYGLVGKVVLWAGIGELMQWHLSLPYWATAACSAVSIGYALRLPPLPGVAASAALCAEGAPAAGSAAGGRMQVWRNLRPVLRILRSAPGLLLIIVQGVAIFVLARIVSVNLFQPVLKEKGFALGAYGAVMSAMTVFEAAGSAYPHWLRRLWSDLNAVFVLTVVMAISIAALAWSGSAGAIVWLCVFSLAAGLAYPVQRQLLNDAISEHGDSRYRATLLSVESLTDRAICAWVASVLAGYVGAGRMDHFLVASGWVSLVAMALLYLGMRLTA